jgi:hypothetical protein
MESGGLAPPFLTLALDGCEWATSLPQEAGWAPELVWTLWTRDKSLVPTRNQISGIHPIAHCCILIPCVGVVLSVYPSVCLHVMKQELLDGLDDI